MVYDPEAVGRNDIVPLTVPKPNPIGVTVLSVDSTELAAPIEEYSTVTVSPKLIEVFDNVRVS